jgi:hypothetical protein
VKLNRQQVFGAILLAIFALIFIFVRARHLLFR